MIEKFGSKGQAAMEYLMTYGWALLVIVIVIAILLIMNPFSAPQSCKFDQVGFACNNMAVKATDGTLLGSITNGLNNGIKIVKVTCVKPSSAADTVASASGTAVARQGIYDIPSTVKCINTPTAVGTEYSAKIFVYYANDDDTSAYPLRVATANIVTKVI